MNSRNSLIVAAVAALSFSNLTFVQAEMPSATPPDPSAHRAADVQNNDTQADQQMLEQLRQIARDPSTAADKLFVLDAAKGNMKEQMLAEAVMQKVKNEDVKKLAQRIAQDHQKAQEQLRPVAEKLNIRLPQQLPQAEQMMIQIVASLPTDDLEKHYVAGMNADHARAVLKYQCAAQLGKDDQVKQYAQQTLPALQEHHQLTMRTAQAIGLQMDDGAVPAGAKMTPDAQPTNAPQLQHGNQTPTTPRN